MEVQETKSKAFTLGVVLSQLFGFLSIILTGLWMGNYSSETENGKGLPYGFNWSNADVRVARYHPIFMVIGIVFFQGEGLITYRLFRHEKKIFGKLVHALCHAIAAALTITGVVAIFMHKKASGDLNMMSPHSWFGIAITVVFLMQFVIGFLAFLFPKFSKDIRAWYMETHKFAGLTIFGCSILQAISGLTVWLWAQQDPLCMAKTADTDAYCAEALIVQFLQLAIVFYGISIAFVTAHPQYRRLPLEDD